MGERFASGSGNKVHAAVQQVEWRDIPGWATRYEISEYGVVRSKDMVVGAKGGKTAVRKGRVVKPVAKANKYLCVTLTDGVSRPQVGIHRLVARAFLGECPLGLYVLHSDGVCTNNHFTNLRYGSAQDNAEDAMGHGTVKKGSEHPMAKVDEKAVREIRKSYLPNKALAEKFGLTVAHISAINRRRVWKHVV